MATVADAWRPTSELEHRLQETVRAGDQESYFRLLADSELVVPVPPELVDGVLANETQPSWPTQEEDGRVHVLAYTSASAMRACLGPSYQHFMTVRFGDIAETWPDARWWLAIDAPGHGVGTVLPIEARMPAWFVRQVAEGDGRPPQVGRAPAPWEELRDQHRDLPRQSPRPEFQPANDVERELLRAAANNDHDLFLQTLAGTDVLLPVPDDMDFALRPGRPGFPWQTREVDGSTVVPVFTSPERLLEASGAGTEYIKLPFTVALRYWPNHDWLLAINSGSPAGGTVLAQQLPGLATWADQRAAQRMTERFEPQNDIEQRLFDAARRGDTDTFYKIVLAAQVLVPADADTPWGIVPGDADFPWRPVPVHGRTSIQVFTSLKWMNEAIGSSRFIMPSLHEMVAAWPDTEWTLVLNPGTPIDAAMPGDQIRTLRLPATPPGTPPSASTPPPPETPAVPVAPAVPGRHGAHTDPLASAGTLGAPTGGPGHEGVPAAPAAPGDLSSNAGFSGMPGDTADPGGMSSGEAAFGEANMGQGPAADSTEGTRHNALPLGGVPGSVGTPSGPVAGQEPATPYADPRTPEAPGGTIGAPSATPADATAHQGGTTPSDPPGSVGTPGSPAAGQEPAANPGETPYSDPGMPGMPGAPGEAADPTDAGSAPSNVTPGSADLPGAPTEGPRHATSPQIGAPGSPDATNAPGSIGTPNVPAAGQEPATPYTDPHTPSAPGGTIGGPNAVQGDATGHPGADASNPPGSGGTPGSPAAGQVPAANPGETPYSDPRTPGTAAEAVSGGSTGGPNAAPGDVTGYRGGPDASNLPGGVGAPGGPHAGQEPAANTGGTPFTGPRTSGIPGIPGDAAASTDGRDGMAPGDVNGRHAGSPAEGVQDGLDASGLPSSFGAGSGQEPTIDVGEGAYGSRTSGEHPHAGAPGVASEAAPGPSAQLGGSGPTAPASNVGDATYTDPRLPGMPGMPGAPVGATDPAGGADIAPGDVSGHHGGPPHQGAPGDAGASGQPGGVGGPSTGGDLPGAGADVGGFGTSNAAPSGEPDDRGEGAQHAPSGGVVDPLAGYGAPPNAGETPYGDPRAFGMPGAPGPHAVPPQDHVAGQGPAADVGGMPYGDPLAPGAANPAQGDVTGRHAGSPHDGLPGTAGAPDLSDRVGAPEGRQDVAGAGHSGEVPFNDARTQDGFAGEAPGGRTGSPPSGAGERGLRAVEPVFEPGNRIDQELYEAAAGGDSDAFLRVLLNANVLVPIPDDAPLEVTPMQRDFRWDAALRSEASVQVFTSLVRLREVLPESRFVYADFRELIGAWPRDDWAMLLNPGTRIGASLQGDQVRALSEWAMRVGLVPARPEVPLPPPRQEPAVAELPSDLDDRVSSPTIMQKVVPHGHVAWYLEQGYDRAGGFVHSTGDVAELQTPSQLYEALGLLYEGSPFSPADEGVYVIRWPAYCPDLYRVPFGGRDESEMAAWGEAGWVVERPPFLGSGFAPGSAGSIREYKVDSVRLPYGAEMYYLGRDRSERFVAMYDPDRLAWLRPEAGPEGWDGRTEAAQ
ncbi:SseB family protein [Actinomadura monticuli]|uniref:SseB family protein n=1 Tax=Actinomadura monticuli TaxID=3097367 RepID=A0ABV4Q574_9ACTN